jgi:hypothetical protein
VVDFNAVVISFADKMVGGGSFESLKVNPWPERSFVRLPGPVCSERVGIKVGEEDSMEEVELFFHQLWHMQRYPTKSSPTQ